MTMLRTLLRQWNDLRWRHHATGLLQAYCPNDTTTRVHIWHRDLCTNTDGALHNHRFELRSQILLGSLTHERFLLTPAADGPYSIWDIPGASAGSNEGLVQRQRVNVERSEWCRFYTGNVYGVRKWDFHHARQEPEDAKLTVTLVRLFDKEYERPASLLHPAGQRPKHAFCTKPKEDLVQRLVHEAGDRLEGRYG